MIIKEKTFSGSGVDRRKSAGHQQESDVAFYLRRAFKNRADVAVFNDLRLEYDGEVAQIDHLVITTLGFCLIESKSIRAEVEVNQKGEWTRIYNGNKTGMPSPIKQVELQEKLLKAVLRENDADILGKLFGLVQTGFGGRLWKTICAISSDAVIDRDMMPKSISDRVLKSEFIADWVDKATTEGQGASKILKTIASTNPVFTKDEFKRICDFLVAADKPLLKQNSQELEADRAEQASAALAVNSDILACKECKATAGLSASYGRYGYYVQCACGVNTSMKQDCKTCKRPLKIRKSGLQYFGACENGHEVLVFDDTK